MGLVKLHIGTVGKFGEGSLYVILPAVMRETVSKGDKVTVLRDSTTQAIILQFEKKEDDSQQ